MLSTIRIAALAVVLLATPVAFAARPAPTPKYQKQSIPKYQKQAAPKYQKQAIPKYQKKR